MTTVTEVLQPLENVINSAFIHVFTGLPAPGKLTRDFLALPCKLGGLGLINPTDFCSEQHQTSKRITAPLVNLVVDHKPYTRDCSSAQHSEKAQAKRLKLN